MSGRGFLDVARDVATKATEFHQRAAAIHAYYGLVLECRDALFRWGFAMPPRDNVHAWVRLRLVFAADKDLKVMGRALDTLVRLRNEASYDLLSTKFASSAPAQRAIQDSTTALMLLDQIETDPTRRAAAIASIQP
jgi:hypothetical protein